MNVKNGSYSTADKWQAPTVKEVEELMAKASKRLGCEIYELHKHFCSDARTFRRWKENSDSNPQKKSTIRFTAWALLVAIAEDRLIVTESGLPLTVKNSDAWEFIKSKFVYQSDNFVSPPLEIVTLFLGTNNSISGLTKNKLSQVIGYNQAHFGRLIEKMNFSVWSILLIMYGIPVESIFPIKDTL